MAIAVLSLASTASAAMTVNTTNDETTSADAACSLREAIVSATSSTIGGDCNRASGDNTVTLPAGHYVLSAALGELLFAAGPTVTINGANASDPTQTWIDAAATPAIPYRVMEVAIGGGATLKNLEVSGGLSASGTNGASTGLSGTFGADGGGILNRSGGALTLDHTLVTDNFTGGGGSGANSAGDGASAGNGAPGGSGGGIANSGSLSITASTIDGNGTGGGGGGGDAGPGVNCPGHFPDGVTGGKGAYSGSGGGIYNLGNATITTSTVSENFTGVGGVGGSGGHGAGATTCPGSGSTVFGAGTGGLGGRGGNGSWGVDPNLGANFQYLNKAGGGGIASFGTLTMTASTISGNNTGAGGMGGTSGIPGDQNGTFRTAGPGGDAGSAGIGGGLLVDGDLNHSQATLTNVTIADNFTGDGGTGGAGYSGGTGLGGGKGGYGGYGGGIWSIGANNLGPVALTHVTIAQNGLGVAGAGGANDTTPTPGIRGQGAGIATGPRSNPSSSGVYLKNTLVANNGNPAFDANCIQYYDPSSYIDLGDLGHNLDYPDSACPGVNGNPLLEPLQNNGGPTETMFPGEMGAATAVIPAASCVGPTDQRVFPRPTASHPSLCDIGAVDTGRLAALIATTTTVTSSANPSTVGQQVTFTATVTPAPSNGTVSFTDGLNTIGTCNSAALSGGVATCTLSYSAVGSYPVQVTYAGDPSYAPSDSNTLTQVVQAPGDGGGSGGGGTGSTTPPGPTGQRAAALKKCKKKKGIARANCLKKAKKLPV